MKWRLFEKKVAWPDWVSDPQHKIKSTRVTGAKARVTFINHATTLIQLDGLNILTDPIWSERASPVSFAGPKRHRPPGVKKENIPKVDLILISHNHYDHMDLSSLSYFIERDAPRVLMGLGNAYYLKKEHQPFCMELDWQDSFQKNKVTVTFLPAQHWSKRTLNDTNRSLWGSFAIKGSKSIYFAGDTGYGPHFKNAKLKFKKFDLSLLPIGAYKPRWFMKQQHMNPSDAVQAHKDLNSEKSIGIHLRTFQLTDEGMQDPAKDLKQALIQKDMPPQKFIWLKEGEHLDF